MDNFSSGGFLQRPQTPDLDPMEFQFMPGPSPRGKPPQGKGPPPTSTTADTDSLKLGVQASPKPVAGSMMPPRTPVEVSKELSRGMTGQNLSSNSITSSSQRHYLPRPEQSLNWSKDEGLRPPYRRRSVTMDGTASELQSSHISGSPSLTINSGRDASYQFKGDRVQSPQNDHSMKAKMAPVTTFMATDANQWGLDLLDMGFDLPKDIPPSAQKRDSAAVSTSAEINVSKRKQVRSLEFYEIPQAKELEARLSELNGDKLAVKPIDNKVPNHEVIDLSDDGGTNPPVLNPINVPNVATRQVPRAPPQQGIQQRAPAVETPDSDSNGGVMSQIMDFPGFGDMDSPPKQGLVEKPLSGRKVGNLIQQQQHKLREMQRRNDAPNRGREERTLSLHSSQGTVTPQPIRKPSLDVTQASRALQSVIQTGNDSLGHKSGSNLGTLSGEQQLSIALTHLAAEKIALEKKLNCVNQDYIQQGTELLTLKQENTRLKSESQRLKSAVSSLKTQVSRVTEHVRVCGDDLAQLGEEAILLRAKARGCIEEGISIRQEIQKTCRHATSIGERIGKFKDPARLVRDMELQRDQAWGVNDLLRQELNDNVGELSLARERVTTLEALLENAVQRTVREKEREIDVADAIAEIKANCISRFEELQTLLTSLLDTNVGVAAQTSDMEKLLTCLVKTDVKEMMKRVNGVEKVLKDIKQEMRQAEKRIRRVALGGGIKVMDKLVTATEALEKLFKQECEGIMKTVDDCLTLSKEIQEDATKQPEYIKAIRSNLESVGERVKSIFTETKDIHEIAINDRQYISHLVGQNESLLERIKLLEGKSEELAVLKINKIQVEKDLRESRDLCDRMSRELEGLKELGKENIKSITYLEKQLETALAVPKEDPSATQTLHSKIEKLERSVESLRAMIAEKEQQAVVKDHQIEDLTTEFLVLKKINETLKQKTDTFEEERQGYKSVLKSQYEEERARYIQNALDERNTERIAVEKNAQRLCERIRVEAQNSAKMLGTDNTKLQSELLELKGKLAECEKSIVGYTQEASQLDGMLKASAEKGKEYQLQISTLSAEKVALESNLEAARDLVRNLENELETLRTSNLEEKLNLADLEVLSLKRDLAQMQGRVETSSGSLNLALNTIYSRDERRELNRSLEDAIAEVQSLCEEISTRSSKKFVESGTCMDGSKIEAPESDSLLEDHKHRVETIIRDEGQSLRRTNGKYVANETAAKSLEDTRSTTLIERTPPPVLQPPSDSSTTEPQLRTTGKAMGQYKDALIEPEECIPATQTPVTKAQGKRRLAKAITHPSTPGKTLQMLLGQSPSATVSEESPSGGSLSNSDGSGTLATSEESSVASKKRVRNESHETHSKGPEPVLTTPTHSRLMIPPAQPRVKRPRYERPAAPKREIANQKASEAGKGETIAGSASRTGTEKNGPKDVKSPSAMPGPQYPVQARAPSPTAAGPKRKRAPTKRG